MGSSVWSLNIGEGCLLERSCWSPYQLSQAGTLKRFQRRLCGIHVLVQTDSTTIMLYLNRRGGGRYRNLDQLVQLVRKIILWCQYVNLFSDGSPYRGEYGLSHVQVENRRRLELSTEAVYRPRGSQSPQFMGCTCGRSVCHQAEQQCRDILFMLPRPSRLAGQPRGGQPPAAGLDWSQGLLYNVHVPLPLLSLAFAR